MTTPDTSRAPAFSLDAASVAQIDLAVNDLRLWGTGVLLMTPEGATRIAPEDFSFRLPLTELPPIEDPAMQSTYPAAQERVHTAHLCRTPIDPVTAVRSPGLQKGNSDLQPATWNPPQYRDCLTCMGKGTGRALVGGGNAACAQCKGFGRIKL